MIREIPELPPEFMDELEKKGYESLYPPQNDAIKTGVLQGKNLLLATPTASGKTLVAMMAAIKAIQRGGKVVYLAPLRALASEKYRRIQGNLDQIKKPGTQRSKLRVFISTGDFDSSGESLGSARRNHPHQRKVRLCNPSWSFMDRFGIAIHRGRSASRGRCTQRSNARNDSSKDN